MTRDDGSGNADDFEGQPSGNYNDGLVPLDQAATVGLDPAALELGVRLLSQESLEDYIGADLPDYHYIADWHCPNFVGIDPSHYIALLHRHGLVPSAAGALGLEFKAAAGNLGLALGKLRYRQASLTPRAQLACRSVPYNVEAPGAGVDDLVRLVVAGKIFLKAAAPEPRLAVDFLTSFLVMITSCKKLLSHTSDVLYGFCMDSMAYIWQAHVVQAAGLNSVQPCIDMLIHVIDQVAVQPARVKQVLQVLARPGLDEFTSALGARRVRRMASWLVRGKMLRPDWMLYGDTIDVAYPYLRRLGEPGSNGSVGPSLLDDLAWLISCGRGLRVDKVTARRLRISVHKLLEATVAPQERVAIITALYAGLGRSGRVMSDAHDAFVSMASDHVDIVLGAWEAGAVDDNDAVEIVQLIVGLASRARLSSDGIAAVAAPFMRGKRWQVLHWATNGIWKCDKRLRAVKSKTPMLSTADLKCIAAIAEHVSNGNADVDAVAAAGSTAAFLAGWHGVAAARPGAIQALSAATRSLIDTATLLAPGKPRYDATLDAWIMAFGGARDASKLLSIGPWPWLRACMAAARVDLAARTTGGTSRLTLPICKIAALAWADPLESDGAADLLAVTYAWGENLDVPGEEVISNFTAMRDTIMAGSSRFKALCTVLNQHNKFIVDYIEPFFDRARNSSPQPGNAEDGRGKEDATKGVTAKDDNTAN
jgi:hypothetical protein